jgi:asparagine synthase (glutamine-hydrolysing)
VIALTSWWERLQIAREIPADLRQGVPDTVVQTWYRVKRRRLTYLHHRKLSSLLRLCRAAEENSEPGMIVEAGCALGGSAIALCSAKSKQRDLKIYDVFGMIPPPSEHDGQDVQRRYKAIRSGQSRGLGGDQYYGYQTDLYDKVLANFEVLGFPPESNNTELVRGMVQETLNDTTPVCLAHVDVDWYEPVMHCLRNLVPRLTARGALVIDDYRDWSGCYRAVEEYFSDAGRDAFEFDETPGHLIIRRST